MKDKEDRLVTLTRVNDEVQGSLIVAALERAGIQSTCTGVFTAGFRAEAPGYVSVMIKQKDLPQAKSVLAETDPGKPVDWSTIDVGEPED